MHKKYGNDGFVAISVALDEIGEKKTVDKFLMKQQATFTNLISEGDPFDWFKKLDIPSYPCVYVFDKENHFVLKLTSKEKAIDFKAIETEVAKLLKK